MEISAANCDFTMTNSDIKFRGIGMHTYMHACIYLNMYVCIYNSGITCLFSAPFGVYNLDLSSPYERAVCIELLSMAAAGIHTYIHT